MVSLSRKPAQRCAALWGGDPSEAARCPQQPIPALKSAGGIKGTDLAMTHPWYGGTTWLDVAGQRGTTTETIKVNGQTANYQQAKNELPVKKHAYEFHYQFNPTQNNFTPGGDVDQDGLTNAQERQLGFNYWEPINQGIQDPDGDGMNTYEELVAGRDPFHADIPADPSTDVPVVDPYQPPSLDGTGLDQWLPPGTDRSLTLQDADQDGVEDDKDAVPYDANLTFAKVPESRYLVIPLTNGTVPEQGVPVAINNLGHVLLQPVPATDTQAGNMDRLPARLWRSASQVDDVPVPAVGENAPFPQEAPPHYLRKWWHSGENAWLDLAQDRPEVLGNAFWDPSTPGEQLPSTNSEVVRVPDLIGFHGFVWDPVSNPQGKWLPYRLPDETSAPVPHFLHGDPFDYADCTASAGKHLQSGGRIIGSSLVLRQHMMQEQESKITVEAYALLSWMPNPSGVHALTMNSPVFGKGTYSHRESANTDEIEVGYFRSPVPDLLPERTEQSLHDATAQLGFKAFSWQGRAILAHTPEGRPAPRRQDFPSDEAYASAVYQATGNGNGGSGARSYYYCPGPWTNLGMRIQLPIALELQEDPAALNDMPDQRDQKQTVRDSENTHSYYLPFSTGPFIVGSSGYWVADPAAASTGGTEPFIKGSLIASPFIPADQIGNPAQPARRFFAAGKELGRQGVNNRGEIIGNIEGMGPEGVGTALWRNGRGHLLSNLLATAPGAGLYHNIEAKAINDNGVIAASAIANQTGLRTPVILVPVEFITKGTTNDVTKLSPTLLIHGEQPRVKLDPVTNASVLVSGLTATVSLSGDISDTIMGTAPQGGGADISKVSAFVNDSPTGAEATLNRTAQAATLWSPFSDKARFSGLSVQIPATGIQRVRVETAANAAGLKGTTEVEIVFSQTWSAPTIIPAITAVYDLIIPAALTTTAAETIAIANANGASFANLLETGPDTRIFQQQSTGIVLRLNGAYAPTAQTDSLACTLFVPGSPLTSGDSSGGAQVTCLETGPQTLRFRHTSTIAASVAGGVPSDTLQSVTQLDGGPVSTAYPIAFRTASLGSDLKLNLFGNDFPIKVMPGQNGNAFATTQNDKPLIGFLIRKEDEAAESESLEFVYYDHSAGMLKRVARASTVTDETWKLKSGTTDVVTNQKLPLKRISMLNADGSVGEGFVPVEIDTLIAIADGDTYVEIQEDSQFSYEFSGVKPGEVLRIASQEQPADRFDLIVPGAGAMLTPHTRKADLMAHAPGIYRTQQMVVVYSTSPDGPQTLTDEQWEALKGLGYLAVHNGSPVVRCAADIDQFLATEGITELHPPSDKIFGDGADLPSNAQAFRHQGFTDHHAMNVYHDNPAKSKKWRGMLKSIFGADFDPDEFTIPVHDKLHKKSQHLATQVWDNLIQGPGGINGFFDADGKLLPGVTSEQVADLRYRTWTAMDDSINAMSGTKLKVDRGRMRIWPSVLKNRNGLPHPLREKFLQGGWRMGSSASEYMRLDKIVQAGVKDAGKLARLKAMRKALTQSVFKGGMKAVAISLACSILKGYAAAEMAYGTLVNGWQETLAQKLNDELGLEDIDLARQIVSSAFTTDLIPGGTRVVQHQLPNGNLIVEGDPTFVLYYANGRIGQIDHFIVTEMKTFPDGTFKMAKVRTTPPHDHKIETNPPWFIRGWYPHTGGDVSEYFNALSKAERNVQ